MNEEYENDYEEAKAIIDQVIGYFQFKSENSDIAQKGIKILMRLRTIVKKGLKE